MDRRRTAIALAVLALAGAGPDPAGRAAVEQARRLFHTGKADLAEEQLRAMVAVDPQNRRAWAAMGEMYARDGRCEEAARAYDVIRATRAFGADEFLAEGDCAMRRGEHALAVERFSEAVRVGPRRARNWLQLAAAYDAWGDLEAAHAVLDRLESVDPHEVETDYVRARLAVGTPAFDGAWTVLEYTLRQAEGQHLKVPALLLLATERLRAGDPEEASRVLVEAARITPQHVPVIVLRVEAIRRTGDAVVASKMLERAALSGPRTPFQVAIRARVAVDLGDLDLAQQMLSEVDASADPEIVASTWYLARARGQDLGAIEALYDRVKLPRNIELSGLIPLEDR